LGASLLRFSPDCLCFPGEEQPEFRWQVEAEIAASVLCPLHGSRFRIVVTRFLFSRSPFLAEIGPLWQRPTSTTKKKAAEVVLNRLLAFLPGEPWKKPRPQK
jgi:hypothetical protein